MATQRTRPKPAEVHLFLTIGNRLSEHRINAGLTLRDLAHQLGVGLATAHRLEAGTEVPSATTLLRVLEYLGVDVSTYVCNQLQGS